MKIKIIYTMNMKLNPWLTIFASFFAFFFTRWINRKFLHKNLT